jgi:5-methylcytosine-specific restriction endonuclease McrA
MTKKVKRKKRASQDEFYMSWEWLKLRYEVLKTYGAVCMLCQDTGHIVVDHIKPRSKYPDLSLEFDNLQVLCRSCNRGKSNDDETDFRPKCPEPELKGDELEHFKSIFN